MAGITRRLELRIAGEGSSLSAPLNLYRGDRGIDIYFRVMDFSYDFTGANLLRNIGSARYNAIVVKPDGSNYVTPTQPIVDNEVKFTITKDLTDEMTEIGDYTLQFLFHGVNDSRVAIPPITVTVKELIADVADGADGQANYSTTNKTTIKAGQTTIEARWEIGELITAEKLNWTRDKAIKGAETSQVNSNKISVLEPKVTTLEKKVTPLQTDVQTLKQKVDDFQNINAMNQEVNGVESITINNTYDGVTKDLTIKGRTLNNLLNPAEARIVGWNLEGNTFTAISDGAGFATINYSNLPLKSNTIYTAILYIEKNTLQGEGSLVVFGEREYGSQVNIPYNSQGVIAVAATSNTLTDFYFGFHKQTITTGTIKLKIILLEGDYTNKPIPSTYFDSITSSGEQEDNKIILKSVGKNLINFEEVYSKSCTIDKNNKTIIGTDGYNDVQFYVHLVKGCKYRLSGVGVFEATLDIIEGKQTGYVADKFIQKVHNHRSQYFVYEGETGIQTIHIPNFRGESKNFQLEENTVATNYEPYKEDIKEIKIPFENGLKSLPNGVCDEIKEKEIIQRVGRVVLNGGENWTKTYNPVEEVNVSKFVCDMLVNYSTYKEISDKFPTGKSYWSLNERGLYIGSDNKLVICFRDTEPEHNYSLTQFKQWLKEAPVTVYYELAEPITHPLYEDYSLRTYQEMTHIYQENNICGDINVSVPSNRDGIIHSNTMEIVELNDKLEQTFDYLGGKIPVYVPESFEGHTTIKDSMIGEVQQLSVEGRTLQNLKRLTDAFVGNATLSNEGDVYRATSNSSSASGYLAFPIDGTLLKPNTTYTMFTSQYLQNGANNNKVSIHTSDTNVQDVFTRVRDNVYKVTTTIIDMTNPMRVLFYCGTSGYVEVNKKIVLLEGDWTDYDLPYFDSITSVGEQEDNKIKLKSTGKNLFNEQFEQGHWYYAAGNKLTKVTSPTGFRCANPIKILPNTKYITNFKNNGTSGYFILADSQMIITRAINFGVMNNNKIIVTANEEHYLAFYSVDESTRGYEITQIEENTVATNYEPYMENIKEINIPFEGGLKELDTIENNSIIQRVGMKRLNGTEEWYKHSEMDNTILFRTPCEKNIFYGMCDRFKPMPKSTTDEDLYYYGDGQSIFIRILKSKLSSLDVDGFKKWLQDNNTTVLYDLKESVIHKINDIQLKTFDETTHITQENNIVSNIKMLAPVSLNKSIGRVQDENDSLIKENGILKEDNKIVAEALLNILQPINTLDEKGVEYKPHSQEEIINKLIEILNRQ